MAVKVIEFTWMVNKDNGQDCNGYHEKEHGEEGQDDWKNYVQATKTIL